MSKKIFIDSVGRQRLLETFGCTPVMIWKALNYDSDSELARRIRFVALNDCGGVANWLGEPRTVNGAAKYEECYGDDVRLEYDKERGWTTLFVKNCPVGGGNSKDITEFVRWQRKARLQALVG